MSDAASHKPRWPRLLQLWFAWILASVLGGMLSTLTLVLAYWQGSGLAIIAGPFVGAAIAAVPQALLVRRSAAPEQRSGRALAWITTSTLGGLLEIGYLIIAVLPYDITPRPSGRM